MAIFSDTVFLYISIVQAYILYLAMFKKLRINTWSTSSVYIILRTTRNKNWTLAKSEPPWSNISASVQRSQKADA